MWWTIQVGPTSGPPFIRLHIFFWLSRLQVLTPEATGHANSLGPRILCDHGSTCHRIMNQRHKTQAHVNETESEIDVNLRGQWYLNCVSVTCEKFEIHQPVWKIAQGAPAQPNFGLPSVASWSNEALPLLFSSQDEVRTKAPPSNPPPITQYPRDYERAGHHDIASPSP